MCLLVAGQWAKLSVSSTGRMLSKSRAKIAWWLFPLLWWQVGHACTEGVKSICPFYKILANSMRQY